MLILQETRNIHESMNKSHFVFIFIFAFYYKYLKYKIIFNLEIKIVLYLKYNHLNGFVGV